MADMVAPAAMGTFKLQAAITTNTAVITRDGHSSSSSLKEVANKIIIDKTAVLPMSWARTMAMPNIQASSTSPLFPLIFVIWARIRLIKLVLPKA